MASPDWSTHRRVLAVRRRSKAGNTIVVTIQNFRKHRTGRNAALVAHYGFLSVFPLLLVFTTVLGFVLQSRPRLRDDIINSAFNRIPIIGHEVGSQPEKLKGSVLVLVVGLLVALWAGMRAFNVLQSALDDVAEVAISQRRSLLRTRARSLLGIAVVGGAQIATAILTSLVAVSGVRVFHRVLLVAGAVLINATVIAAAYRWLCVRRFSWRQVAPGAVAAGIAFAVLQIAGTVVVGRAIANASPVYGTFASVIALVTWLSLHALDRARRRRVESRIARSPLQVVTAQQLFPFDDTRNALQGFRHCLDRLAAQRANRPRHHFLADVPAFAHERATVLRRQFVAPNASAEQRPHEGNRWSRLPRDAAVLLEFNDGAGHRVADACVHRHSEFRAECQTLRTCRSTTHSARPIDFLMTIRVGQ